MDSQIEYHLQKIKATQAYIKDKGIGNLKARVFLRATGAIPDHKGNVIINKEDLLAWFENGDYLKSHTEWDTV